MKKLFGEFLIEKNLASESQVLEALIEQIKGLPSVCEVVYDKKILSGTQVLKAMAFQMKESVDFKTACIRTNIWSEKIETEINKILQSIKVPLGEILVKKQIIDHTKLTKALDQFLSENINAAAPTDKNQPQRIPPQKVGYVYPELDTIFQNLNALESKAVSRFQIEGFLSVLFVATHKLKGVARFKSAERLEKLFAIFEHKIEDQLQEVKKGGEFIPSSLGAWSREFLSVVADISSLLEKSGSEIGYFQSAENVRKYESLVNVVGVPQLEKASA